MTNPRARRAPPAAGSRRRARRGRRYFANLAPHELEIIACLIEECGEACQAAGKVLRHGLDEYHPARSISNRTQLAVELGQISALVEMAIRLGVLRKEDSDRGRRGKWGTIAPYLHHIVVDPDGMIARRGTRGARR